MHIDNSTIDSTIKPKFHQIDLSRSSTDLKKHFDEIEYSEYYENFNQHTLWAMSVDIQMIFFCI